MFCCFGQSQDAYLFVFFYYTCFVALFLVNHKMPICFVFSTTLVLWHCFWLASIVSDWHPLFLTGIHCFWLASIVTFIKAMKYKISHQQTKESMWVCINKASNYTKSCNLHCQWELCLSDEPVLFCIYVWKIVVFVHMFGWPQGR